MKPDLHETHKQHTFDSFCKKVLVHEANNGHRDINRRAAISISIRAILISSISTVPTTRETEDLAPLPIMFV